MRKRAGERESEREKQGERDRQTERESEKERDRARARARERERNELTFFSGTRQGRVEFDVIASTGFPGGPIYPEAGPSIPNRAYLSRGGSIHPEVGLSLPRRALHDSPELL